MKHSILSILVAAMLLGSRPSPSVAATELQFWHAMTGMVGERVSDMAAKFNAPQNDYIVNAVQMEHIFSGNKTPQQGLDDAVAKGNEILKEFAAQGGRTGDR
jgi:ABC-type glycerol-3-phosphate transport system substrate-binding protein